MKKRHNRGKLFSIVVISEGAKAKQQDKLITKDDEIDQFGHIKLGGVGQMLADAIEKRTGFETRVTILGHIQRGGTPSAYDRVLATRFGVRAVELIHKADFGKMVALAGSNIIAVPLEEAVGQLKTLNMELYELAKIFFG